MKKKLVLFILLVLLVISGIVIKSKWIRKSSPMYQLGTRQVVKNEGDSAKNIKIKVEGYYDITTTKTNKSDMTSSQLPELSHTRRGQFVNQEEGIRLDAGEEVIFNPAKFEKIPLKNKIYTLSDKGNYLIGHQFPSGNYLISVDGELVPWEDKNGYVTQGMIQLVVYSPKAVNDSSSFKLTEEKKKIKVKLTDNKLLAIKTTDSNVSVVLTPVK